jgi:hypothetical protein
MQRKECSCASIEMVKGRVSSRITTDKINHGLEIRRANSLDLFTRSSLIGTLMRAGLFIAAIPILASAQTREQIAATQAQIAVRQIQNNELPRTMGLYKDNTAQNNADPAISQRDALQAQLDAISQGDALELQLEDVTLAANRRDSLQNQPKSGEAAAAPAASVALATRDLTLPPAAAASPNPSPAETLVETRPAPKGVPDVAPRAAVLPAPPVSTRPAPDGGGATPDRVPEGGGDRLQGAPGAVRVQEDEPPASFTSAAFRSKTQERHGYRPRPAARPQPQPTFWQRLFGSKETKEAKNAKPSKPRQ